VAGINQPNQFGNAKPTRSPDPAHCTQCEMMLTDALDRTLSPEDQALFDRHLSICPDCSRMFIDAKLGADLLSKLHDAPPEPSAALLERILSATGPATASPSVQATRANTLLSYPAAPAAAPAPTYGSMGKVLPFHKRLVNAFKPAALGHTFMQPRLAMTAAMAFFSIALTLNLTGVRLTELRASDFTPSSLRRSFYDTNARVVRSIDNLRVVYELESRVRDLQQRDNEPVEPQAPASGSPAQSNPGNQNDRRPEQPEQRKQASPHPRSGSSRSLGLERSRQVQVSFDPTPDRAFPQPAQELREAFVLSPRLHPVERAKQTAMQQGGQA
jgi:hypothetical protein